VDASRRQRATAGSCVNNDTVEETRRWPADSVGLHRFTSVPFSTQYEYTPSYNDFGHTDDKAHFFAQMDFLTPELYRTLMPGRVLVRAREGSRPPGWLRQSLSFQSIDPFHADCIKHYRSTASCTWG
jgi:hypothetical protein